MDPLKDNIQSYTVYCFTCIILNIVKALLQPNPNLRYEKKILSKIDSGNQLGRPAEESQLQALGKVLEVSAVQMKPHNDKVTCYKCS